MCRDRGIKIPISKNLTNAEVGTLIRDIRKIPKVRTLRTTGKPLGTPMARGGTHE